MKFTSSITAVITACAFTVPVDAAADPTWSYHARDKSMVTTSQWDTTWETCGGDRQSPIDIDTTGVFNRPKRFPLKFHGQCTSYNLSEPHEPLEVDAIGGDCGASLRGEVYDLKQFHLHAPSEHTIDGKQLDGEIHFVHMNSETEALLVLGIFLEIGPVSDKWMGPVLDALEQVNSTTESDAIVVDLEPYATMIRKAVVKGAIYNYPGSLTTPGCGENADWWVVERPITITSADFDRLHKDLVEYPITDKGKNARPVQPLNDRIVTRYKFKALKKPVATFDFSSV
ncbi:unnamed protein product [Hyaloperonospora brassicae]|uniref:carbonic anhydrase n=1 Tax=Hyaloperonospora brassicae TaxID=162125 RepID=A0AAV0UMM5_HYABA|nr:unnamed protein product [Hyaloperonospora brassicae]